MSSSHTNHELKKAINYCSASSKDDSSENAEVPMTDIGLVIDDNMRICEGSIFNIRYCAYYLHMHEHPYIQCSD